MVKQKHVSSPSRVWVKVYNFDSTNNLVSTAAYYTFIKTYFVSRYS